MIGIERHHKRNAPVSLGSNLGLIGAVLQIIISLVVMLGLGFALGFKNDYFKKQRQPEGLLMFISMLLCARKSRSLSKC